MSTALLIGCTGGGGSPDARAPDATTTLDATAVDATSLDATSLDTTNADDAAPRDASRPPRDVTPPTVTPPAWLAPRPLNEWFEIPGTAGAGGAAIDAFSGFALRDSTSEIIIAAAGGHGDSSDNRVASIRLDVDAPAWVMRHAPSPGAGSMVNIAHYADGLPSSRHIYQSAHVIESHDRVFLFGARAVYGAAYDFPAVDAFDLTTNRWDPADTWTRMPSGAGYGAVRLRPSEDVFTNGLFRWSAADRTYSMPVTTRTDTQVRWPIAHDSSRNELLTLQWGDGQGYNSGVQSSRVVLATGVQTAVTFRPSAALTMFEAEMPVYASMDYDPDNDRFLFYSGVGAAAGRVYVINAEASDARDISLFVYGPGSVTLPATHPSGIHNRMRYVPALRGFVLLVNAASNLYFLRTG